MKILFILESFPPNLGGVETLFKHLTDKLAREGHQITVLTNQVSPPMSFREKNGPVTVYRMPFLNRYFFTILAFFPSVYLALKNDLIHTTSYNAAFPSYFAGLLTRRKVIVTFHEYWGKLWFDLPFMSRVSLYLHFLYEQFLVKLPFNKVIGVSDFTKMRLIQGGIPEKRIVRIYNGLDYTRLDQIKENHPVQIHNQYQFLYYGRLGISKGLDLLLKAIHILSRAGKEFELVMIIPKRPKPLYRQVMELINSYDIGSHVRMFHELEEIDLFTKVLTCDCVVIPSYSEGFGFTAAESIALGKPVISSQKGALSEVVSGKYLAMESFNAESLADSMVKAMNNKWEISEIKQFPLRSCIQQYMKLYENLKNRTSRSGPEPEVDSG